MEKTSAEIANLNVDELLKKLNEALAEEWLSYYQYWIGSKYMDGPLKSEIEHELLIHASQELHHATLVVGRILHLGGKPLLDPREWFDNAKCQYDAPTTPSTLGILENIIRVEGCAIKMYEELAEMTVGKDPVTYKMAKFILNEELGHDNDIKEDVRKVKMHSMEFPLGV
jgi:bacterioferritin